MHCADLPEASVLERLRQGVAIPAHPLALTANRTLDERRQRALTRYYLAAGAGGVAVGVHTTQFTIREHGLYRPVLELAAECITAFEASHAARIVRIAGICGRTSQALREAEVAQSLGYHAGLLSFAAMPSATVPELIAHARTVSEVLPLVGFYLQPSVGGRVLDFAFWRRFVEIENVIAIKIAPFNRYQTIDVVRAVAEAGRVGDIALYTGNDDSILLDLVTPYRFTVTGRPVEVRITGGLLGQWAVWTRRAAEYLAWAHRIAARGAGVPEDYLALALQLTDANGALFDVQNGFAGCVAGIHEVLVRQGLLAGRWCLDPNEDLSPGQYEEIDRVYAAYPHLNDDDFVREHLAEWLA